MTARWIRMSDGGVGFIEYQTPPATKRRIVAVKTNQPVELADTEHVGDRLWLGFRRDWLRVKRAGIWTGHRFEDWLEQKIGKRPATEAAGMQKNSTERTRESFRRDQTYPLSVEINQINTALGPYQKGRSLRAIAGVAVGTGIAVVLRETMGIGPEMMTYISLGVTTALMLAHHVEKATSLPRMFTWQAMRWGLGKVAERRKWGRVRDATGSREQKRTEFAIGGGGSSNSRVPAADVANRSKRVGERSFQIERNPALDSDTNELFAARMKSAPKSSDIVPDWLLPAHLKGKDITYGEYRVHDSSSPDLKDPLKQ